MSSTDNRIVKMQFDNATFKKEALATKGALQQVDAAVAKTGSGKGLLSMASGMETVRVKAGAMQVAAVTAIANITNRAVNAGISLAKSLTLDPIKQGFDEYELKMKSIQTILSNTKGENLASVTEALDELNTYSDKTIYNFANMTENIGKLTTAGVGLDDATAVVKGFHNMVALAGGDATAAAGAMEQFSYGLQAGTIKAMDWMSISNRGLGSQSLQKAFFETARAAGSLQDVPVSTTFEEWTKTQGGFKASLEQGWLTSDVATKALKVMTGDMKSVQEVMALGFDEKTAKDMLDIADSAVESATKVRTFTAFMGTLKESIASGWSKIMETIFGDFNEATKLFTGLSTVTSKYIQVFFGYISRLVEGFSKLGGRTAVLETIKNLLSPILAVLGLIATAWKAVFGGGDTGRGLATFAKALQHITRPLKVLSKLITGQITPFEALQRMFSIVSNGARNFGRWIAGLLGPMGDFLTFKIPAAGGIIDFFKNIARAIGDAIEKAEKLVESASSIGDLFSGKGVSMPDMPSMPSMPSMPNMPSLPSLGGDGAAASVDKFAYSFENLNKRMSEFKFDATPMRGLISGYKAGSDSLDDMSGSAEKATTVGGKVAPAMGKAWEALKDFFSNFNIEDLMAAFNLAVLSTFVISISRFMNTLSRSFSGFIGTGEAINGVLGGVQGALESFQTGAKAKLILNIGIAIGILAVSLWILSRIPMEKMLTGLAGMAGIMMIMKVGLDSITKAVEAMDKKGAALKLTALSVALLALGIAILLLATAFLILNHVDWTSMLKGLGTIVVVMTLLERMGKIGANGAKNLMASSVALTAMAFSLVILAGALLLFKLVDWESMGKAGLTLGALTAAMAGLAAIPGGAIAKVGTSMLAASFGFLLLANALLIFGMVSWESIAKGGVALAGLTASLAVLQVVGNPVAIAGLIGLGLGMIGLATAMLILNSVDWSSLAKAGVIMLGLIIGFAAFMAVVTVFAPVLIILSAFAGSIAFLALALTGLMLAFALILPLMAIGTGAFAAFATGAAVAIGVFLTTLALQAPIMKKSILKIMQVAIDGIVEAVPMVIDGFKRLWAAIKAEFSGGGKGGGKNVEASAGKASESWMSKIVDSIKKKMPSIVAKVVEIGGKFIDGLTKRAPAIAAKGAQLIIGLVNGITSQIGGIVTAAVNLVVAFAAGIGANLSKIVDAGIKLIADFLHAVADGIRSGAGAIGGGLKDIGTAFFDVGKQAMNGLIDGIKSLAAKPKEWIESIVGDLPKWARKLLGIASPSKVFANIGAFLVSGLTKGIQDNASSAIITVAAMVSGTISVAGEYVDKFIQDLDQKALAATAKATGLQAAAERAAKAAEKTKKNKKDDRKARGLQDDADRATTAAEKREEEAEKAREASARADEFAEASLIDKAQMRAEDATMTLDDAKAAEYEAESKRQEADALRAQAKKQGVSNKDAKAFREAAKRLDKQAEAAAARANTLLETARTQAGEAMALQKQAGDEAVRDFDTRYANEAAKDAQEDTYNKMSEEEKIAERKRQAAELQARADQDLLDAKRLAYTDLDAANEMADRAIDAADQARDYLREAADMQKQIDDAKDQQSTEVGGEVVDLDPTEAASIAFGDYAATYDSAYAAGASGSTVEFNQYNTSPEALNPTDVYRHTNNQLAFAGDRLQPVA